MKSKIEQGNSKPKQAPKKAVLKELEDAFSEAKDIKTGKKQGLTLEQIFIV